MIYIRRKESNKARAENSSERSARILCLIFWCAFSISRAHFCLYCPINDPLSVLTLRTFKTGSVTRCLIRSLSQCLLNRIQVFRVSKMVSLCNVRVVYLLKQKPSAIQMAMISFALLFFLLHIRLLLQPPKDLLPFSLPDLYFLHHEWLCYQNRKFSFCLRPSF